MSDLQAIEHGKSYVKLRPLFVQHAAPQAVAAEIVRIENRIKSDTEELAELLMLLGQRTAEEATGVWPYE